MQIKAAKRLGSQLVVAESIKEYVRRLKKEGVKSLGTGAFSTVFQHPTMPNVAVKMVTLNDPYYLEFAHYLQRNPGNPYFPKVLQIVSGNKLFTGLKTNQNPQFVFMEKLKEASIPDLQKWAKYCGSLIGKDVPSDRMYHTFHDFKFWKQLEAQDKDWDLKTAAMVLTAPQFAGHLDLEPHNFMKRGNHIVIADPFATWESLDE